MARTFTLANGAEVFRSFGSSLTRLAAIEDHADFLSDAEVRAIHKMANKLEANRSLGAIANDQLMLAVFAKGFGPSDRAIVA